MRIHRTRTIHPRDVTTHKGIPVTTVARMLVDLTDVLAPLELTNVIHEAAFKGRFSLLATRDAMARANGRHNLHVLERAIEYHLAGSAGFKSHHEAAQFALLDGLPEPLVNTQIHGLEVDLHWPDARLVVELDGPGHSRPRTRREDAARDAKLRRAGYSVLRLTP